jgi:type II secretory pathway component PulF
MTPESVMNPLAWISPIALGIVLLIVLGILPRESERGDLARLVLRVIAWTCLGVGLMLPMVGAAVFAVVPIVLGAVVAIEVLVRNYRAGQRNLLLNLAVASERLIPLTTALEAFAADRRGGLGSRAVVLAEYLRRGWSLPDALQSIGWLVPRESLVLVRVGHDTGSLPAALRLAADTMNRSEPIWDQVAARCYYLFATMSFAIGILTLVMLKIIPAFEKIFMDFGVQLPPRTATLIAVTHAIIGFPPFAFLMVMLECAVFFLAVYAFLRWLGVPMTLPGTGWFTRRLDTARILRSLALAVRQGRPLTPVLELLALRYPNHGIRSRLRRALEEIRSGKHWGESLQRQKLLKAGELGVLQAAERLGNFAWALDEMADACERRLIYRIQAMLQVVFPAAIVVYGLVVMFVIVALFDPLVALIQKLSQ